MKRVVLSMALALSLLTLAGCDSIDKIMRSWLGHHYSQLIASWGPPQQVFEDGSGGRILIYTVNRYWMIPASSVTQTTATATAYDTFIWGSATSITTYNPAQTIGYTAYRMFWINTDGEIYQYAWKGL